MVNSVLKCLEGPMTYRSALLGASILMMSGSAFAGPTPPSYVPDLLPPNPVAGQCYGRVEIPAQYETTTQRVLTRDAHQRVLVQQAELRPTTERVMVKEPSVRYVVRQPTYGTVTENVMTRPGYEQLSVSEPSFQTVTETLHTGRPRLVWKRGNPNKLRAQGYKIHSTADGGAGGRGYSSTVEYGRVGGAACGNVCEIWCLVEEPGESVTVTRQSLQHSGQVNRIPVPAQYQSISKQVVTDPGGVQEIPVPGEYRDLHVEKLVRRGGTATVNVPAEYGHAQGRKLVSESRYEWRRVACKPGAQHYRPAPGAQMSSYQSRAAVPSHIVPSHINAQDYSNRTVTTQSHATTGFVQGHSQTQGLVGARPYTATRTVRPYQPSGVPASPRAPFQGTLSGQLPQTSPAYISTYRPTPPAVASEKSSTYPDRHYTGPAYDTPEMMQQRDRAVDRYESRHEPKRTRR